jgi:hypothetical protein
MSTRQIRKRVEKLATKVNPAGEGLRFSGTLEDLCRLMWRQDRKSYMEMVGEGDSVLRGFGGQFEREDAERLSRRK